MLNRTLQPRWPGRAGFAGRPRVSGRRNATLIRIIGAIAPAILVAGCGIFSGPAPTPAPAPTGVVTASPVPTITPTPTPTPSPTPKIVKSVVLVASSGEPKDWTPAGLAWKGVQGVASSIGATPSLLEPVSDAELKTDLDQAAAADGAVVVTVGPAANPAVQAAAAAHPGTHFFELEVAVPDGSPANVHGLVFDEAEAGYLGGYIAAAFTTSGKAGMVGDSKADTRSSNYAAGFKNGAAQASSSVAVTIAYAGSANQPDLGRTAAAGLIKAGNGAILAMPSLAGIGALRQACAGLVPVVAVDTDAWQIVPDIHPCLIVSVMKRYDVAVSTAIQTIAGGGTAERLTVYDVANGGIALSDFHAALPAGFQGGLDAVMATLRSGPPRPTPVASASPSSAAKSPSPKP